MADIDDIKTFLDDAIDAYDVAIIHAMASDPEGDLTHDLTVARATTLGIRKEVEWIEIDGIRDRCDGDCGHRCDPDEGLPCRLCEHPDTACTACLQEDVADSVPL